MIIGCPKSYVSDLMDDRDDLPEHRIVEVVQATRASVGRAPDSVDENSISFECQFDQLRRRRECRALAFEVALGNSSALRRHT